jgi:arylsulfatase A-like enzyme
MPESQYVGAPHARGFTSWHAGSPENLDDFFSWLRVDDDAVTTETVYATTAQVSAATSWWASATDPKFLQVSLNSPHGPYHFPPPEQLGGFISNASNQNRRKYESEIRSADWALGQLLTAVGPETIVALCGDNGTPGNALAPGQVSGKVKSTCYEGGVRVPLAIRSGYTPGSSDRLVHLVDVPATLLTMAGLQVPATWDGRSLVGPARATCLSEAELGDGGDHAHVRAAISKTHKLMRTTPDGGPDGPELLFDLVNDPTEEVPLDLDDPANAAALAQLRAVLYG